MMDVEDGVSMNDLVDDSNVDREGVPAAVLRSAQSGLG